MYIENIYIYKYIYKFVYTFHVVMYSTIKSKKKVAEKRGFSQLITFSNQYYDDITKNTTLVCIYIYFIYIYIYIHI